MTWRRRGHAPVADHPGPEDPEWTNYDGCYTMLSVAADSSTVYVGGHMQYMSNPMACKAKGAGAVTDPGLAGLNPSSKGSVLLNSAGHRGPVLQSRAGSAPTTC